MFFDFARVWGAGFVDIVKGACLKKFKNPCSRNSIVVCFVLHSRFANRPKIQNHLRKAYSWIVMKWGSFRNSLPTICFRIYLFGNDA